MKIYNNYNDIKRFFSVLEVLSAFRRILTSFGPIEMEYELL